MDDAVIRRRFARGITAEQTESLLEFIEQNPVLVKKRTLTNNHSKRLWSQCAKKLNVHPYGVKKTSNEWARYWSIIKYNVRKKAAAQDRGSAVRMTPIDKRIWNLINMSNRPADKSDSQAESTDDDESSPHEDIQSNSTASQRLGTAASLRRRTQTSQPNERDAPPVRRLRPDEPLFWYPESDSDSEDNLSAFWENEKRKLAEAQRLNDAVKGFREQIQYVNEIFGELKECVVASLITR